MQVLQSSTGDEFEEDKNINDYLKKRFALPKVSRLLNFTYAEILNWSERKRKSVMTSIAQKKNRLEDFMSNPENWVLDSQGNFGYTFLPMSYLP